MAPLQVYAQKTCFHVCKEWRILARQRTNGIKASEWLNCLNGPSENEVDQQGRAVDVGGTSVACPTIYITCTVLGWWFEHRMLSNLRYIHSVWLVVRSTIYFTNTKATVSWISSRESS